MGRFSGKWSFRCVAALSLAAALSACGGGGGAGTGAPPPPAAPPPPSSVTVAAGVGEVTLSWEPVAGAASYVVYWSTDPAVTRGTGTAVPAPSSPLVLPGLAPRVECWFVVTSVDGSGAEGEPSLPVSAVPGAPPPAGAVPDVGQYFDRAVRAPDGSNYDDVSGHPLAGLTDNGGRGLLFGFGENCLACHYASGPPRTSDECLRCHFEGGNAPSANHGDGALQLAAVPPDGSAPKAEYPVPDLPAYDAWCLQCHGGGGIALGGIAPSRERRTLLDDDAWTRSRHRALGGSAATGCITCHAPHGEGNGQLVRSEPAHRAGAGGRPARFGVFPSDNLSAHPPAYGRSGVQRTSYRARTDNFSTASVRSVFADADEDFGYCNLACHGSRNDRFYLRDGTTGLYLLNEAGRRIVVAGGVEYSIDNYLLSPTRHIHPSREIVITEEMSAWLSPSSTRYHYPLLAGSDPAEATAGWNASSPLPFFPDLPDGDRDFLQGYLDRGPIRYRYSCSTCHDPHGTTLPNSARLDGGFPDLRQRYGGGGSDLCRSCHP